MKYLFILIAFIACIAVTAKDRGTKEVKTSTVLAYGGLTSDSLRVNQADTLKLFTGTYFKTVRLTSKITAISGTPYVKQLIQGSNDGNYFVGLDSTTVGAAVTINGNAVTANFSYIRVIIKAASNTQTVVVKPFVLLEKAQ